MSFSFPSSLPGSPAWLLSAPPTPFAAYETPRRLDSMPWDPASLVEFDPMAFSASGALPAPPPLQAGASCRLSPVDAHAVALRDSCPAAAAPAQQTRLEPCDGAEGDDARVVSGRRGEPSLAGRAEDGPLPLAPLDERTVAHLRDAPSRSPLVDYRACEAAHEDLADAPLGALRLVPELEQRAAPLLLTTGHLLALLDAEAPADSAALREQLRSCPRAPPSTVRELAPLVHAPPELARLLRALADGADYGPDYLLLCRYMPTARARRLLLETPDRGAWVAERLRGEAEAEARRSPFELCWMGVLSPAGAARLAADRAWQGWPAAAAVAPEAEERDRALLVDEARRALLPVLAQMHAASVRPVCLTRAALACSDRALDLLLAAGDLARQEDGRYVVRACADLGEAARQLVRSALAFYCQASHPPDVAALHEAVARRAAPDEMLAHCAGLCVAARCLGYGQSVRELVSRAAWTFTCEGGLLVSAGGDAPSWCSRMAEWGRSAASVAEAGMRAVEAGKRLPLVLFLGAHDWSPETAACVFSTFLRALLLLSASAQQRGPYPVKLLFVGDPSAARAADGNLFEAAARFVPTVHWEDAARAEQYPRLAQLQAAARSRDWRRAGEILCDEIEAQASRHAPSLRELDAADPAPGRGLPLALSSASSPDEDSPERVVVASRRDVVLNRWRGVLPVAVLTRPLSYPCADSGWPAELYRLLTASHRLVLRLPDDGASPSDLARHLRARLPGPEGDGAPRDADPSGKGNH